MLIGKTVRLLLARSTRYQERRCGFFPHTRSCTAKNLIEPIHGYFFPKQDVGNIRESIKISRMAFSTLLETDADSGRFQAYPKHLTMLEKSAVSSHFLAFLLQKGSRAWWEEEGRLLCPSDPAFYGLSNSGLDLHMLFNECERISFNYEEDLSVFLLVWTPSNWVLGSSSESPSSIPICFPQAYVLLYLMREMQEGHCVPWSCIFS